MREAFRRDVIAVAYRISWWDAVAVQAAEIAQQYRDLGESLVDASLVALAARLQTIEHRHLRRASLPGDPAPWVATLSAAPARRGLQGTRPA